MTIQQKLNWLILFIADGLSGMGELTDKQIKDDILPMKLVRLINELYDYYGPKNNS